MAQLEIVKQVSNCILYKDEKGQRFLRIDNVRLSYPFVGTPSSDEDDEGNKRPKWRLSAMLPKETHDAAKQLIEQVIQKIIKENDAKVSRDRWFLTDGDDKEAEEMQGHWLISASDGKVRPRCRDRKSHVMDDITKIDDTFYGGCWASVLIRPWYFDGKTKVSTKVYPKRVSAGLSGVMFMRDDKPFGSGRIDDSDAWGGVVDDDDNDGMGGSGEDDDDL